MDLWKAIDILVENICPVETEEVELPALFGRILATDIIASEDVPSFSRSPYDGYAFLALDTLGLSEGKTVTLEVIEDIRAGEVPRQKVSSGKAIRLMTGAPLPEGADCICKYEETEFGRDFVTLKKEYRSGENVIRPGEDIKKGDEVVRSGVSIDPGIMGVISSLGMTGAYVYKKPVAGIISTGDEVAEDEAALKFGMIRNSNRYIIAAALSSVGITPLYLGHVSDDVSEISNLIDRGMKECDILISTGGVSAGDFDLVPDALSTSGFSILFRGVDIKPGMASVFGKKDGKLFLGLSGNPASALTTLQCVCMPALRRLEGLRDYSHEIIKMKLKKAYKNKGGMTRLLRGRIVFEDGSVYFDFPDTQGNAVISSAVGANGYGIMDYGDGVEGSFLQGWYI